MANYDDEAVIARDKLNKLSPSMCMAKWLQVSLHLPQGRTHSCYHPPTHKIPLEELQKNPNALHNTKHKLHERKLMKMGERPEGCQYCWNIEDSNNADTENILSDRHYRSSEWWVQDAWNEVTDNSWDYDIAPRYVEVNFNQSCNFKCSYCSPHLSTAWEEDVKRHGSFTFSDGGGHNDINYLSDEGLMPLEVARKNNPYIEAFWKWFPVIYPSLKIFRMTGGEPLMDKNTFRVFDYIKKFPNPNLEISLTTNLCPPSTDLFERFLNDIKELERSIIPDNNPSVHPIDHRIGHEKYFTAGPNKSIRHVLFFVKDPLDGSTWDTWKQRIVKETLHGMDPEDLSPGTEVISWDDISENFAEVGPCTDSDSNSFTYVNTYVKDSVYNKWTHERANVNAIKHISIFVSLDGIGTQAEYIRDGLDWEMLQKNIERLLSETQRVSVTFINTFNILSVPSLRKFLDYILYLRSRYGYKHQKENNVTSRNQRIWFDIPYLRYPDWMSIQLADEKLLSIIQENVNFMKSHVLSNDLYGKTFEGFKKYEVLKLERNLSWAKQGSNIPEAQRLNHLLRFYEYFNQYDVRRNFNFKNTFPEMKEFWVTAKRISEQYYES